MTRQRVAVVGGGLAGITAALGCADAGCDVTLLEARSRLGGLTHSFRRGDLWVDNGQHVFLRCCSDYLALLDRLGVADLVEVQPRLDLPVRSGARLGTARLRRSGSPVPLHLAGSLARYRWLAPAARLRVARAMLALRHLDVEDPRVDELSFGEWLSAHGQPPRAVETVWNLIGVATLNARAEQASLALAAAVFQRALLDRVDGADIGWSRVPLQQLHGDAATRALAEVSARVVPRAKVDRLTRDAWGWRVSGGGDDAAYDEVVLATPPPVTEALLPPGAVGLAPGWSRALGSSPIVNIHLVLDRTVLPDPFTAAVDSPLQWIFDRTAQAGLGPGDGQYLAVSVSAADELVGRPVDEVRRLVLPELNRLLPDSVGARVRDFFVTREPHATFRAAPGSRRLRPPTATTAPGLHLAGAWTDTGWPATMEGAVRSGHAAVAALLRQPAPATMSERVAR